MPIDTTHPDYAKLVARAKRMRDAIAGQEAVHEAGTDYLPQLSGQSTDEFDAYLTRAGWYGATGRTHEGLVGMVFRKAPTFDGPAGLDEIRADIDLAGSTLDDLARQVFAEVMATSRVGVLVEFPRVAQQQPDGTAAPAPTVAQARAANLRAYATVYPVESMINWRVERVGNATRITLMVLSETVQQTDPEDPFETVEVEQIRALMLLGGVYVQQVWQLVEIAGPTANSKPKTAWQMVEQVTPLMNGRPMQTVPFFVFGPGENSLRMQDPPLQQLADVNFGHYRNTADLEHGAHFAGLPTPYVTGYSSADGESIAIGSPTFLEFPDPQAKVGFLEFTGQGLQALEARCAKKEEQMAALGARMLAPEKAGVEAGQTLAMRHSGESSVLGGMANACSAGLEKVLQTLAEWEGVAGEITYRLNTDFVPEGMTAQELTAMVQAWQSGGISFETFVDNLKRGEIIASDVSAQDERDRIDANPPLGLMAQQQQQQQGGAPNGGNAGAGGGNGQ